VGDRVVFAPGNKESTIASIERWNAPAAETAEAGASIGITLNEQIFVERGHIGSHESAPPIQTNRLKARIFWMGDKPLALFLIYLALPSRSRTGARDSPQRRHRIR
jgi:bifunctional enzyme CysN/CysC